MNGPRMGPAHGFTPRRAFSAAAGSPPVSPSNFIGLGGGAAWLSLVTIYPPAEEPAPGVSMLPPWKGRTGGIRGRLSNRNVTLVSPQGLFFSDCLRALGEPRLGRQVLSSMKAELALNGCARPGARLAPYYR